MTVRMAAQTRGKVISMAGIEVSENQKGPKWNCNLLMSIPQDHTPTSPPAIPFHAALNPA